MSTNNRAINKGLNLYSTMKYVKVKTRIFAIPEFKKIFPILIRQAIIQGVASVNTHPLIIFDTYYI